MSNYKYKLNTKYTHKVVMFLICEDEINRHIYQSIYINEDFSLLCYNAL